MTSTFDDLAGLWEKVQKEHELIALVEAVFDEAISQINKVEPKRLNWEDWKKTRMGQVYFDLYGELGAKAHFLNDAHTLLDHGKYHLRCVKPDLDTAIRTVYDWLSNRDEWAVDIDRIPNSAKRNYPKIMDELKKLIKDGTLKINIYSRKTKKWLEES